MRQYFHFQILNYLQNPERAQTNSHPQDAVSVYNESCFHLKSFLFQALRTFFLGMLPWQSHANCTCHVVPSWFTWMWESTARISTGIVVRNPSVFQIPNRYSKNVSQCQLLTQSILCSILKQKIFKIIWLATQDPVFSKSSQRSRMWAWNNTCKVSCT